MSAALRPPAARGRTWRGRVLLAGFALIFALLAARLFELQVLAHERLAARAAHQASNVVEIPGPRGDICDRHGRLLAISVPTKVLLVEPREIPRAVLASVERAAGVKRGRLTRRAEDPWELVTRDCKPRCEASIEQLIAEGGLPNNAVHWQLGFRRVYPNGSRAAHLIGFASPDGSVTEGIERSHDHLLASSGVRLLMARDARQNTIAMQDRTALGSAPSSLMLTIDLRIQAVLEDELAAAVRSHGARGGQGLVLDPLTGEILAMAAVPSFDPNRYSKARGELHRNPVVEHAFEPGSVVKPLTAAALIESGLVGSRELVDCENGCWTIGSRSIRDHRPHALLTLPQVLEVSSNIGIAKFAQRLPGELLYDTLARLGLGRKTSIELPGESSGVLHRPEDWHGADKESIAFGHALAVTHLQLGLAYGALANRGVWTPPRITRAWGSPDERWHPTSVAAGRQALQPSTARLIARWLRRVVDGPRGTGKTAAVAGYAIAGKTGTAEKIRDGEYDRTRNITTFAGFAPAEDPVVVVAISIDEPASPIRTAAATAAPVFSRVMGETLRLLRAAPSAARPDDGAAVLVARARSEERGR